MQECSLVTRDLACRRGERILFRGLSFALAAGEALHISGPNGIGKSSLMRIVAGLLRPFSGSVASEGGMALLDERHALDMHLPLGEALRFWRGIDHTPSDDALDMLGLAGLIEVPVRYLSTGQKKRAALARLLGQQAPIWLLDEPLNGLDASAVATVEGMVADHCRRGGIALVASHQPILAGTLQRIDLGMAAPA